MKMNIPPAAIAAIVGIVVVLVGVLFLKGASGESEAPKRSKSVV